MGNRGRGTGGRGDGDVMGRAPDAAAGWGRGFDGGGEVRPGVVDGGNVEVACALPLELARLGARPLRYFAAVRDFSCWEDLGVRWWWWCKVGYAIRSRKLRRRI